jgi:hypothetical protein
MCGVPGLVDALDAQEKMQSVVDTIAVKRDFMIIPDD